MKRYSHAVSPVLLVFAVVAAIGSIAAQKKESGSDPYTPTKLEWLAVRFNAQHGHQPTSAAPFYLVAHGLSNDENTIILEARMAKDADRQAVNKMMQHARGVIEAMSVFYGFDGWLIIREQIATVE